MVRTERSTLMLQMGGGQTAVLEFCGWKMREFNEGKRE